MTNLFLHELIHLLLTLIVGGGFYWRYRNWQLILAAFLFGFFIDIDHLFDYFVEFGLDLRLWQFFDTAKYIKQDGTVYVLFHGWEFIPVLGFLSFLAEKKFKLKGLTLTILFAYGFHLLWDHFSYAHHLLSYSFVYRTYHGFSKQAFEFFIK